MTGVNKEVNQLRPFRLAFVAAIGGFLFGFDLGMIGAANVYLKDQFQLSDSAFGFATASAVLGCVFGPALGAWLCDAIGRKKTMLAASLLLATSAVLTAMPDALSDGSNDSTMRIFNLFRFVGGVGVGLCSVASPMYIAEIAPPKKRGGLGLMYQLAIVVGHAVAPLIAFGIVYTLRVGYGVADDVVPESASLQAWRWMFFSETVCILVFVAFMVGLPSSPRWLAEKGRIAEAEGVLARVYGPEYARQEIAQITESLDEERGSWAELLAPGMRFALVVGVLLTFFNNWTGWSVIGGYVPRLLELAGFSRESAIGNFVAVYGAMGLMTVLSLLLMDRVGRRPLWTFASLMMAVIMCVMGFFFYYGVSGWPILIILGLVTIPHGIALGGIPWLMMSELFPTRLRAKAVSVTTTVLWVFIFSGVYLFPMITGYSEKVMGNLALAFWPFTGICLLSLLFGLTIMPETKGRTLEEIGSSWQKK